MVIVLPDAGADEDELDDPADAEPEVPDVELDAEPDADPDAEPDADPGAELDAEPEPAAEPDAEPAAEPDADGADPDGELPAALPELPEEPQAATIAATNATPATPSAAFLPRRATPLLNIPGLPSSEAVTHLATERSHHRDGGADVARASVDDSLIPHAWIRLRKIIHKASRLYIEGVFRGRVARTT